MTTKKSASTKAKKKSKSSASGNGEARKDEKKDALAKNPVERVVLLSKVDAETLERQALQEVELAEKSLIRAALALNKFIRGQGWLARGFGSMTEWREEKMNFSEFYNLRNVMRLIDAGVSPDDVQKMNLTNINTMVRKLPSRSLNDPKIIDLACGPVGEFDKAVSKKSEDMGQHVEDLMPIGARVSKSVADSYALAMRVAQLVDGANDADSKIEVILATYLNSQSETPNKSRLQVFYDLQDATKSELAGVDAA